MAKGKKKGKGKSKKKVAEPKIKILEYELITIEENFKEELNQNIRLLAVNENQHIFEGWSKKRITLI